MSTILVNNSLPFVQLGKMLRQPELVEQRLEPVIRQQAQQNTWFTPYFCRHALDAIASMLDEKALQDYIEHYATRDLQWNSRRKVAVISAGNIPLAAFHDFFCILLSGNDYIGKLSSQDKLLLPALAKLLTEIEPSWAERITFVDKLSQFDAIIATGSDNSARYFEYYFQDYPHLLRQNRNSVAVLTGDESEEQLKALCEDIYLYFGLGCRSVSKLFVPENYDFEPFLQLLHDESAPILNEHNQYLNNLEYQKAIRLMNKQTYLDAGTFLLDKEDGYSSPISVLYYDYYHNTQEINTLLNKEANILQCIVSNNNQIEKSIPFGKAQSPDLLDYPDGVDILQFLGNLTH